MKSQLMYLLIFAYCTLTAVWLCYSDVVAIAP